MQSAAACGILVSGVDLIKWNGDGKITEFKVPG